MRLGFAQGALPIRLHLLPPRGYPPSAELSPRREQKIHQPRWIPRHLHELQRKRQQAPQDKTGLDLEYTLVMQGGTPER